ncbi:LPXTG cell wall anchor domain-containing protein [Streptomyces asoensis]|uniref:LPXTG cell wall anchor domain-containing protein n=1 Tax=Streptomyces asoensis TaxID=249586 RepID=A0A6M4X2L2_9ACTN|nr:LPXTG cell wall anchor domain-containing protein [Streptomyces asoensis]
MLTATAAGTLLGALWFVPSANASQDTPARTGTTTQITTQARAASTTTTDTTVGTTADGTTGTTARTTAETAADTTTDDGVRLADTGSFDTTPYVVGGTTLLALGAGFVVYSVRRERLGF